MSDENTAHATRIPAHGVGKLVAPFPPGVSGNPGERPAGLREVQKLAREKGLTSLRALIGIVEDVDADGIPNQDGRVVVVAAQTILTWGHGKPPDYDPREDRPPTEINLAVATTEEKRMLLDLLRRGLVTEATPAAAPEQIEGMTVEPRGDASD
jgi:hypothetical protein